MPCNFSHRDQTLEAYIRNELNEPEKSGFEKHLFSCASCRKDLQVWDAVTGLVKSEGQALINRDPGFIQKGLRWFKPKHHGWIWAGSGLAGAAAAVALFMLIGIPNDSVDQEEPFAPYLEERVGQVHRSAALTILSPQPGEIVDPPPRFQWQNPLNESLTLVLLDAHGNEITSKTVGSGETQVLLQNTFSPGVYYWKLESANELIYVGKFRLSGQ